MEDLTNTIEAIVFASGDAVPVRYIVEKLNVTLDEANAAIEELKERYRDRGICVLTFNGKVQMASDPRYKDRISDVLIPIREKELTKTVLECAALVAYKQPVTKPEIEDIRQVSCDYAIKILLDIGMIEAVGRKDAVGKPILYATTDEFLKRFKLNSIDELPDYDELMAQIAELNGPIEEDEDANYLFKRQEYNPDEDEKAEPKKSRKKKKAGEDKVDEDGFSVPDIFEDDDVVIEIK